MGFIDVNGVSFSLPDGRPLLADLAFRVTEGRTTALIGANGAGKSTLLRIIRGDLRPDEGSVQVDGGLGVMDQFVGTGRTVSGAAPTVAGLLVSVAPARVRDAALELEASEDALIERDDTATQMRYASALAEYAEAGKVYSAVFDNAKIKRVVPDFTCTVPWADGVRRSLAWFLADASRRTIDEAHDRVLDRLIEAYAGLGTARTLDGT